MYSKLLLFIIYFSVLYTSSSCSSGRHNKKSDKQTAFTKLKFMGAYEIPHGVMFENTVVGGLSGIDYNPALNCFYLISDDRSAKNPARFYTASISISRKGIDSLKFTSVNNLLQFDGFPFPSYKLDPYNTPDPEAIRYNRIKNELVWSNEGERSIKTKEVILTDPSIWTMRMDGWPIDSYLIPDNMKMQVIESGPRQNSVFEGLSFSDDYKDLFVSVEEPLYEDGPKAGTEESASFIRILKFDASKKTNIAQYAYKLDPVAYAANPSNAFKINGVSEILYVAENKLLVVERSFSTGRPQNTIKLFIADLERATDIKTVNQLKDNPDFRPAEKRLLLNLDKLKMYIDNIEGVSFGPTLPNGHKTLLFVSDNNFNPLQKTQLLLFEVKE